MICFLCVSGFNLKSLSRQKRGVGGGVKTEINKKQVYNRACCYVKYLKGPRIFKFHKSVFIVMRKRHVEQIFKVDRYEQLSIEALHAVFKRFEAGVTMNKNYIQVYVHQ